MPRPCYLLPQFPRRCPLPKLPRAPTPISTCVEKALRYNGMVVVCRGYGTYTRLLNDMVFAVYVGVKAPKPAVAGTGSYSVTL